MTLPQPGIAGSPGVFLGHSHLGRFVVRSSEQSLPKQAGPNIMTVAYRVELEAVNVLPRVDQKFFRVTVRKAEGLGAEQLGLQDWFPTASGEQCVLAFNPERLTKPDDFVFLGAGSEASAAWTDGERYYNCIRRDGALDPAQVASAITQPPHPLSTFFRLIMGYDRSAYNDPQVCRAIGAYLANASLPPLERRKPVAHYMSRPQTVDSGALRDLASGMLVLALDLHSSGETVSAAVVFQRMQSFFPTPEGKYQIEAPHLDQKQLAIVKQLLGMRGSGLTEPAQASLFQWLSGKL